MSIAILVSGQGAQTPEMFDATPFTARGLAVQERALEANWLDAEAAQWLRNPSANPTAIFENHLAQPLIALWQLMVFAELELPAPRIFAGYSLGEVVAHALAGSIEPDALLRLATTRARLMDTASGGGMLAITGLAVDPAAALAEKLGGEPAIYFSENHLIAGFPFAPDEATHQTFSDAGAEKVAALPVSVPAHTRFLNGAVAPFREALEALPWRPPSAPVLAGVDASRVLRHEQFLDLLPEQIHRAVRWDWLSSRLLESGCDCFLELGPGAQLSHSLLALDRSLRARSVAEFHSFDGVRKWLGL